MKEILQAVHTQQIHVKRLFWPSKAWGGGPSGEQPPMSPPTGWATGHSHQAGASWKAWPPFLSRASRAQHNPCTTWEEAAFE